MGDLSSNPPSRNFSTFSLPYACSRWHTVWLSHSTIDILLYVIILTGTDRCLLHLLSECMGLSPVTSLSSPAWIIKCLYKLEELPEKKVEQLRLECISHSNSHILCSEILFLRSLFLNLHCYKLLLYLHGLVEQNSKWVCTLKKIK